MLLHRSEGVGGHAAAVGKPAARTSSSTHLGVAGGVFANVRLNRILAEQLDLDEVFVFPAMGDEGLPVGGSLVYLLQRDGIAHWLKQRRRLKDVYLGRDYTDMADATLSGIGIFVGLTATRLKERPSWRQAKSARSIPAEWNMAPVL